MDQYSQMADDIFKRLSKPNWGALRARLQSFDPYYHYSDDVRVYKNGEKEKFMLKDLINDYREIDEERTKYYIKKYCPKVYDYINWEE